MVAFPSCEDLQTKRMVSGRLCEIILALNITKDGLIPSAVSYCQKDKIKSSLVWVAYAGHLQADPHMFFHLYHPSVPVAHELSLAPSPLMTSHGLSDFGLHPKSSFPYMLSLLTGALLSQDSAQVHLLELFFWPNDSGSIFLVALV